MMAAERLQSVAIIVVAIAGVSYAANPSHPVS
jgi:hypothetical protein